MKEHIPASKSPYEAFIPADKLAKNKVGGGAPQEIADVFSERELLWHETERAEKEKMQTHLVDSSDAAITETPEVVVATAPQEKKMSAAEMREAREQEEEGIRKIAQDVFDGRMRGLGAEGIDAMLVAHGIKPWTPEAEEFMRKWDWEQAEKEFATLRNDREKAKQHANEAESKKTIELSESEDKTIGEKFSKFGIRSQELEAIDGFETLSYGQRLLLAENLSQLTLGRIQEEAGDRYQKSLSEATLLKSNVLGRVWQGISKRYQIAKHEQHTAHDIKSGGVVYHGETLKQLVEGATRSGLDVVEKRDGSLELQYVKAHPLMDERQKEEAREFNHIATEYSALPYEWSLSTATDKQKSEYKRISGQFERAKEHLLQSEKNIIGDTDALLFVADIESKIRMNQFLNTHPIAEQQIQSIESDAIWAQAVKNVITERGIYFGAGVATRSIGFGLLGAIALPAAATIMGGWMARKRAAATLREREIAARHGKKDTSKEARNSVTADGLTKKIETLLTRIEAEDDEVKRTGYLASLQVRLEYTQNKLDEGLIDFGSVDRRIVNQYGLMDMITMGSSTVAVIEAEQGRVPAQFTMDTRERLDQFLESKGKNISNAQQDYLRKQMIYGAGLGAASFAAGYLVRDIMQSDAILEEARVDADTILDKPEHIAGAAAVINEASAVTHEPSPIILDIGKRGPEGAFIDELRKHPEIAERLGIKDIGKEAHSAWTEFAKTELQDPRTQQLLEELGYEKNADGYANMMRHIEHGQITLEERGGVLHMRINEDTSYLPKPTEWVGSENLVAMEAPAIIPIEAIVENQFGLDGAEYNAIKHVTVGELLTQIPSRDEAWAIWREEVPGKVIALPHDGIYGALEFKKHIDLAEYIHGFSPSEEENVMTIDEFLRARVELAEQASSEEGGVQIVGGHGAEEVPVIPNTQPEDVQIVGGHAAEEIPVAPQARPEHEPQIGGNSDTLNDLSNDDIIATEHEINTEGNASDIGGSETVDIPESTAPVDVVVLLNNDIYENRADALKNVLLHYRTGKLTAEDFATYYAKHTVGVTNDSLLKSRIETALHNAVYGGASTLKENGSAKIAKMIERMQSSK